MVMDKERAKEIAASPIMANVTYDGMPIYIQYIDEDNDAARIYFLDQPDTQQVVPLNNLKEE